MPPITFRQAMRNFCAAWGATMNELFDCEENAYWLFKKLKSWFVY